MRDTVSDVDRGSVRSDGPSPDGRPSKAAPGALPEGRSQPDRPGPNPYVGEVPCACGGSAPCDVDLYVLHVGTIQHLAWRGRQDPGPTYLPEFAGRHPEGEPMG